MDLEADVCDAPLASSVSPPAADHYSLARECALAGGGRKPSRGRRGPNRRRRANRDGFSDAAAVHPGQHAVGHRDHGRPRAAERPIPRGECLDIRLTGLDCSRAARAASSVMRTPPRSGSPAVQPTERPRPAPPPGPRPRPRGRGPVEGRRSAGRRPARPDHGLGAVAPLKHLRQVSRPGFVGGSGLPWVPRSRLSGITPRGWLFHRASRTRPACPHQAQGGSGRSITRASTRRRPRGRGPV
jgi:hypothetical protein